MVKFGIIMATFMLLIWQLDNIIEEDTIDEYVEITINQPIKFNWANRGGLLFDGTSYHLWQNGWKQLHNHDPAQLPISNSATLLLLMIIMVFQTLV